MNDAKLPFTDRHHTYSSPMHAPGPYVHRACLRVATGADVRFATQIVPHAADAVSLALQLARVPGASPQVVTEAFQVAADAEHLRATTADWLRTHGFGSVADYHSPLGLRSGDPATVQRSALVSLSAHHVQAAALAAVEARDGTDELLLTLARDLLSSGVAEAGRLRALAKEI